MSEHTIFSELERELIDAARMILKDGVERLKAREPLLPSNRSGRKGAIECRKARDAMAQYLCATYGALTYETAVAVLIDPQGRLICIEEFPRGKASSVEMSPRILAGFVVNHGAAAVLLAHNHPSGDNTPSRQDVAYTNQIGPWLAAMDVQLIDHLVLNAADASAIVGDW